MVIVSKRSFIFGSRQWLLTGKKHKRTFWDDGNVPHLDLSDFCTGICTCKIHQVVQLRFLHLLYVNDILI